MQLYILENTKVMLKANNLLLLLLLLSLTLGSCHLAQADQPIAPPGVPVVYPVDTLPACALDLPTACGVYVPVAMR